MEAQIAYERFLNVGICEQNMAGIAGVVVLLFELHSPSNRLEAFDLSWILWIAILLAGLLGSARMVLMELSS